MIKKVATAAECAKQCGAEPQCNGWSHFAPAKRFHYHHDDDDYGVYVDDDDDGVDVDNDVDDDHLCDTADEDLSVIFVMILAGAT